jgi:hypothetical protein
MAQAGSVARLDPSLDHVDRGLEADVRVRLADRARWELEQAHREAARGRGRGRDADEGR